MSRALDAYRASMVEADMEATLTDVVEYLGGAWAHIRASQAMAVEGLPDLVIAAPPTLYLLELKRLTGKPSPAQIRWLSLLGRCDAVVSGIVRPVPMGDDYGLDEILALLEGRR